MNVYMYSQLEINLGYFGGVPSQLQITNTVDVMLGSFHMTNVRVSYKGLCTMQSKYCRNDSTIYNILSKHAKLSDDGGRGLGVACGHIKPHHSQIKKTDYL